MEYRKILKHAVLAFMLAFMCFTQNCECETVSRLKGIPKYYTYGPFSGTVTDLDTGEPIEGVLVFAGAVSTGARLEGLRVGGSNGFEEYLFTGKDGKYFIPEHKIRRFGDDSLETEIAYTFFMYKKGYVLYDKDEIFPCADDRADFKWQNNQAKLEPWRAYYTYTDHVRWLPDILYSSSSLVDNKLKVAKWELKMEREERAKHSIKKVKFASCDNRKKHEAKPEK